MTEVRESFAPRRRMAAKSVGALTALALMAAACGSTATETVSAAAGPDSTEAPSTADAATPEVAPAADGAADGAVDLSNYPAVVVKDVATGDDVEIAGILANGETPTLLWFWAPH